MRWDESILIVCILDWVLGPECLQTTTAGLQDMVLHNTETGQWWIWTLNLVAWNTVVALLNQNMFFYCQSVGAREVHFDHLLDYALLKP